MERGERGGRRKKLRKMGWIYGERRRDKRVMREGEGRKTVPPMPQAPPPKKKKIVGTQIFLVQLNGVWAPLCKTTLF